MNRTKKFLYNTVSTGIYQVIVMIVGFITPRIILKYYGSEINGLVSSILQFISYISLVEAGLSSAAIYALYKPLADNNYKEINGVVSAANKFYNISGYIFTILVLVLAFIYPVFVKSEILNQLEIGLLVVVLSISGTLEFFALGKYRALLTADQKTYIISIASIIHIILNTFIIFVLAKMNVNIILLRLIALTSVVARSLILMIYVKNKYKYINYKEEPNNKALNKRWDALILQILGTIRVGAPVVIATMFTTLKSVSVFSIYNMVMSGINGVLEIFMSGLSASFGEIIAKKDKIILQKAYKDFEFMYYVFITVVYATSFIMINPFVKLYTKGITDIKYDVPILGFLFVLNGLLHNMKTPQGMLVISAGLFKETKLQTIIQGILLIVIGVILVQYFGLIGIMIASIISNLYRIIDLVIFIPRNVTKLKIRYTFFNILRSVVIIAIVLISGIYININCNTFIDWMLYAICITIYSIVISLIFILIFNREQMQNVVNRIKGQLFNGK